MENLFSVTFKSHTDRIETRNICGSFDFKMGDMVIFKPNGLLFRVDNKKILRWMQESGNYVKIISE